jgi:hypothetical protein
VKNNQCNEVVPKQQSHWGLWKVSMLKPYRFSFSRFERGLGTHKVSEFFSSFGLREIGLDLV